MIATLLLFIRSSSEENDLCNISWEKMQLVDSILMIIVCASPCHTGKDKGNK